MQSAHFIFSFDKLIPHNLYHNYDVLGILRTHFTSALFFFFEPSMLEMTF